MEKNVFYLNKDLQIETQERDIVAIAYYFKDKCHDSLYGFGKNKFKKNVEITFLNPIGHFASLLKSEDIQKAWKEKNYPKYYSTLPSETMCRLIRRQVRREFDNCWTRSYDDDGWPCYRNHPIFLHEGTMFLADGSDVAQNVYVSLVLTKEEFMEINPDIKLED